MGIRRVRPVQYTIFMSVWTGTHSFKKLITCTGGTSLAMLVKPG